MNYQTAGIAGAAAFLLSFVSGLFGGVPLFDMVLRALFWAAVGFGGFLGGELLLRNLLPDLFAPVETTAEPETPAAERVDITLEDDGTEYRESFIEEVEEPVARRPSREPAGEAIRAEAAPAPAEVAAEAPAPESDEEMPEIGSFLDAFKPAAEGEEAAAPEYAEYAPAPAEAEPEPRRSGEVTIDGEAQDPAILAKAIQTVMKREP